MIANKQILLSSVLASAFVLLGGCGESDKGSASAPAPASAAAPALTATEEAAFDINNIEKADGVVYQDEIYANWPYN